MHRPSISHNSSRGRGATKWENRGSETFCATPPPPQDRVKLIKLLHKNYPKTFCAAHSAWVKLFPSPPPFHKGKASHDPPPLPLCSPPPPSPQPVISDQSLILFNNFKLIGLNWYTSPKSCVISNTLDLLGVTVYYMVLYQLTLFIKYM